MALGPVFLEDAYEYNIRVVLVESRLRVVPVGFSATDNQMIDEVTMTFDKAASQSVFRLEVPVIPEFFPRPVHLITGPVHRVQVANPVSRVVGGLL